jgi:hypothetical protein
MDFRTSVRLLLGSAALLTAAAAGADAPRRFDPLPWVQDYRFLKNAMEAGYANLAWFASPEGGVDLPALDRRTERMIEQAESEEEARLALKSFVASFHDGHFSELPFLTLPLASASPEPPRRNLAVDDPVQGCAALGFADRSQAAFSLPFESLPGFSLESDGVTSAFRAGTIAVDGRVIGIVRLKNFSRQQYPSECLRIWASTDAKTRAASEAFGKRVTEAWFETLAAQLRRFQKESVAAVLVDVGTNSGGDESGDWAARLFTARPVRSAKLMMSAAKAGTQYLDEQISAVKQVQAQHPGAASYASGAAAVLARWKQSVGPRYCDMSWVWRERRPWQPLGCSRLIEAGWASGIYEQLPPGKVPDEDVAAALYWPARVDRWRGSWTGATYVLTNGTSYSAAEMFAAVMKDNGIARTIGTRTGGDGCGFMTDTEPVVLPNSRLRYRMPNCVRLRKSGADEVAGIQPDIEVLPSQGESGRARAVRLLKNLSEGLSGAGRRD